MRRTAVVLTLLLLMGCHFYDMSRRAAVAAVLTSILRLESYAPLTQSSVARAANASHGRRLISRDRLCSHVKSLAFQSRSCSLRGDNARRRT